MSRTTTKKLLKKAYRNNERDFTLGRNTSTMSLHERKTKTKQDILNKSYKKSKIYKKYLHR